MQFIDLKAQYDHLKNRIDTRIKAVLDHSKFIMGPEVGELEEELSQFVGVKNTITCANGTDALQLALMALNIGEGAAVFVPTFTFFASAEAVSFVGATPIFVDSDNATFNICTDHLESQIKSTIAEGKILPKAIMAVDLFGLPANYPRLKKIADKYNLKIIEDAAQGFGGSINSQMAGSFGDIATTSFFPAKPLGCYGDGGAVFTDNDNYADLVRSYRVHGKGKDKYDNVRIGMNSRLDTIQAAILLEKLAAFPQELVSRNQLAKRYSNALRGTNKLILPQIPNGYSTSWAQYTIVSQCRDAFMSELKASNIPSVIYYGKCMHQQSVYRRQGQNVGSFPIADKLSASVFSLPMHPYMDEESFNKVIFTLKAV
ncbi:DegT/DnrJ/EryC1/StrS aminotransferase family protein [Emcibacteraceae bacterium]|nr:DegT/DnrJ/EryC1/StrS aminotransferase family protein [Emcibacteraceae bacterium]